MPTEGRSFEEKFRILDEIAQGDLASVYLASDTESSEVYVLKLFKWEFCSDGPSIDLLKQEAANVEKLRHPNIMPVGTLGQTNRGQLYAVRGFVEGRNLGDLIRHEAPLNLQRACAIGRQVASALEASHNAGILHGDLKPANILLVEEESGVESVRVLGFGTFPLKRDRFMDLAHLAFHEPDSLIGSPHYISPERAIGTEPDALDGRSDLYSLGVILYEMLTGKTPFRAGNPMEVLLGHMFDEPQPLRQHQNLEVPEVVETLVMRTLAKNRKDRPSSATALVDQLQVWAKYEGGSESPEAATGSAGEAMASGKAGSEASPAMRMPFLQVPKAAPEDSAPTVQLPKREVVAKASEFENPQRNWSWTSVSGSEAKVPTGAEVSAPAANSEVPPGRDLPVEDSWPSGKVATPERESGLPFDYAISGETQDSAPTVLLPVRDRAAKGAESERREFLRFSSNVQPSQPKRSAPEISFPTRAADTGPSSPGDSDADSFWALGPADDDERHAPASPTDFPAAQSKARDLQAEGKERKARNPSFFTADLEPAGASERHEVPGGETMESALGSVRPELASSVPHSFVADLGPELPAEGAGNTGKTMAETDLDEWVSSRRPGPPLDHVSAPSGSVLFTPGAVAAQKPRRGHPVLTAAILVILIVGGGGGAWLYYTGRSYWFQPQYVISRLGSLLTTESSTSAPSGGPTSTAPATSPSALPPSQTQAQGTGGSPSASSAAPPVSGTATPPTTSSGSAGISGENAASQVLRAQGASQTPKHLQTSQSRPGIQGPNPKDENSAAVEDAIRRGNYYFLLGQYDAAIGVYNAALKQSPHNPKLFDAVTRAKRAKAAEAEFLGH